MTIEEILGNQDLLEIARQAVEDALIDFRDSRISQPLRGNGLVVRERDGKESSIIRFGPEEAIRIGLQAIVDHKNKAVDDV